MMRAWAVFGCLVVIPAGFARADESFYGIYGRDTEGPRIEVAVHSTTPNMIGFQQEDEDND